MTISETFERVQARGELALMPYLTAGFPSLPAFHATVALLADNGADVIEIGIPFSDPIADGPAIQYSSQIALENGARLPGVLAALREVDAEQPIVLMSYLNPLMTFGRERLFDEAARASVAGLIIPDLPCKEAEPWVAAARAAGVSLIFLVAPTSPDERIRQAAELTGGFLYAVSVTGTTGVREQLWSGLPEFLARVRKITAKPLVVGFGISQPEHIRALRGKADGAVVASRIIQAMRDGEDVAELIQRLKQATRSNGDASRNEG